MLALILSNLLVGALRTPFQVSDARRRFNDFGRANVCKRVNASID
jgi:hypothetical protein